MVVDIDRVMEEIDKAGINLERSMCVSMAVLTGARWPRRGGFERMYPIKCDDRLGCAESLLAQWEGLDTSEAVETSNTVDLRGQGRLCLSPPAKNIPTGRNV